MGTAQGPDPQHPGRQEQFVDLYKEFEPSLVNSTVYIMAMAMQMATFAINYKVRVPPSWHTRLPQPRSPSQSPLPTRPQGPPFMESLPENKPLLWSLAASLLAVVGLLLGSSPDFNSQFGLVDIPVEASGGRGGLGFSLTLPRVPGSPAPAPTVQAGHRPGPASGLLPGAPGRPRPTVLAGDPEAESAFLRWRCWYPPLTLAAAPPGPKEGSLPHTPTEWMTEPGPARPPAGPAGPASGTSPGPAPLVNKASPEILSSASDSSVPRRTRRRLPRDHTHEARSSQQAKLRTQDLGIPLLVQHVLSQWLLCLLTECFRH